MGSVSVIPRSDESDHDVTVGASDARGFNAARTVRFAGLNAMRVRRRLQTRVRSIGFWPQHSNN